MELCILQVSHKFRELALASMPPAGHRQPCRAGRHALQAGAQCHGRLEAGWGQQGADGWSCAFCRSATLSRGAQVMRATWTTFCCDLVAACGLIPWHWWHLPGPVGSHRRPVQVAAAGLAAMAGRVSAGATLLPDRCQGACGTWGHLAVEWRGSAKAHIRLWRPLQVPSAAGAARAGSGSPPAALWPDWCPGVPGHREAPCCGVWGSETAHNRLWQALRWRRRQVGVPPRRITARDDVACVEAGVAPPGWTLGEGARGPHPAGHCHSLGQAVQAAPGLLPARQGLGCGFMAIPPSCPVRWCL